MRGQKGERANVGFQLGTGGGQRSRKSNWEGIQRVMSVADRGNGWRDATIKKEGRSNSWGSAVEHELQRYGDELRPKCKPGGPAEGRKVYSEAVNKTADRLQERSGSCDRSHSGEAREVDSQAATRARARGGGGEKRLTKPRVKARERVWMASPQTRSDGRKDD